MFENTNRSMDKLIASGIPGNDIIVFRDGQEVYRSYRGYSDMENRIPMNGRETYNMYSCSKPITAAAAMQLVEKKLLSLDEPLYSFLPEFKNMVVESENGIVKAETPITIRHLFCMTAGFDYDTNSAEIQQAYQDTDGCCPTVETIRYLAQKPLLFQPGTKWNYSLCHDVLAAVIEVVSGMRFGEYIRQNIFAPLNMNHSTFLLPESKVESLCAQYRLTESGLQNCGKHIVSYKFGSEYESGGAGLISTPEDYILFLEALRKGDVILSRESIDRMCTDQMQGVDFSLYWAVPYSYGLGVRCAPQKNTINITDFGWGGAAGSYLAADPVNRFSVFYAMHVLDAGELDGRKEILASVRKDLKIE